MPRLSKARKELLTTMMKETIYEAAASVLDEHGLNGVTMDRVAKAANVARSNLYDYFRDKDELVQFIARRITEPIHQAIAEIMQSDQSATEKLASIYRTVLTNLGKHQSLMGLLARNEDVRDAVDSYKRKARASSVVIGLFAKVFEQGINEGKFRRADPVMLARMFIGCGGALADMQLDAGACNDADQIEQHVKMQVGLFLHGISTDDGKDAFV